jgi:TonB-dependent starch-binding outer membrane protein SusC
MSYDPLAKEGQVAFVNFNGPSGERMSRLGRLIAAMLAMAMLPTFALAQARGSVSGQVTDATTRQGVVGALVRVVGTNQQVVTNEQGRYALSNVPAGARTLQVSRVGYRQTTAAVTVGEAAATVNVTLAADAIGLDEIVAVGYGEARRRNVAGAVGSLRPDQAVRDLPVTSVNAAMQGRLAGVQISQNSGTPGVASPSASAVPRPSAPATIRST